MLEVVCIILVVQLLLWCCNCCVVRVAFLSDRTTLLEHYLWGPLMLDAWRRGDFSQSWISKSRGVIGREGSPHSAVSNICIMSCKQKRPRRSRNGLASIRYTNDAQLGSASRSKSDRAEDWEIFGMISNKRCRTESFRTSAGLSWVSISSCCRVVKSSVEGRFGVI